MRTIAIIVAALALASVARDASACPAGSECLKYRRMVPVEAQVTVYRRADRALPPSRGLAAFLTESLWVPRDVVASPRTRAPRTVRFVNPARISADARRAAERIVLIRQLERRNDTQFVEIDGSFYSLGRCADGARRVTSCLTFVGALPEESMQQQRFATPP
jgi:hypothetical protein